MGAAVVGIIVLTGPTRRCPARGGLGVPGHYRGGRRRLLRPGGYGSAIGAAGAFISGWRQGDLRRLDS